MENVIDNGVRHNQADGWMRVELCDRCRGPCEAHGRDRRTVSRSGQVGELAQPFRRLGAERTGSDSGAGLGLSIVAAIAAAHHGTLTLHARQQGGLRVAIEHSPHDRLDQRAPAGSCRESAGGR